MKTNSIILIVFISLFFNNLAKATKYYVFNNGLDTINCSAGDTIAFHSLGMGSHGVWLNDVTFLAYGGWANSANELLVEYVVQPSDYNFIITYQAGSDWSGVINVLGGVTTPIELVETKPSIDIFPNPAVNQINIEIKNISMSESLYLYDYQGKLLKKIPAIYNQISIDISEFSIGFYFIKVGAISRKIIKI